ncbi:MAG: glycerol-3-phosphate dehydrogenase/oxidase, partial [Acidobacteriia bacterium]|nr:glycerol-3-phosphate dehydrogenase/oxidase [Terriglobia bacterium]
MTRSAMLALVRAQTSPWDILVIGGGATGMGIALDASARGYSVLLLERGDFGQGTSSRSTKLIHGGVRYLEQGNIPLVVEALKERGLLSRNAPGFVRNLAFVVPSYEWWEAPFYGAGLKLYELLAGRYGFGAPRILSREETLARLPNIRTDGLRGGVVYFDGQFDDCRLLLALAATAAGHGAALLNYAPVVALLKDARKRIAGVRWRDAETGEEFETRAKAVINAAGPFSDEVRRMADPLAAPLLSLSQGIHLVFDASFLAADSAIMVPHTADGRVMFAIPWLGHTLVGTTDTPVAAPVAEPAAQEREIEFILHTASLYLAKAPSRADALSVFAGLRPLVAAGAPRDTASLARSHMVRAEETGLLTVCGGKWTPYRRMA